MFHENFHLLILFSTLLLFFHSFIVDCWFVQNCLAFQWQNGNGYCYFHLIIDPQCHHSNDVLVCECISGLAFLHFDFNQSTTCKYLVECTKWNFNANTIMKILSMFNRKWQMFSSLNLKLFDNRPESKLN